MQHKHHSFLPILALLATPALAQTQYTVRILAVPGPYLGGNISSINNGVAAGWAYTDCTGKTNCDIFQAPFLWNDAGSATPTAVDLTGRFGVQLSSQVQAAQPDLLGGYDTENGVEHAILFNPLLSTRTDLNGIFFGSQVNALCSGYQGGWATISPNTNSGSSSGADIHAMLWFGAANSWVDLHNEMDISQIWGCDGNVQVGYAASRSNATHAVLWKSSRTTQVDLHSGPYLGDVALGISGNIQVGWGATQGRNKTSFAHALLWRGTSNSLTDIHPAGFDNSQAFAAAGNKQVGFATSGNDPGAPGSYHGLLWFGSAASVVDLNRFLPPGYTDSQVDAVDPVTGIIAGAARGPKGVFEPAVWLPIAQ